MSIYVGNLDYSIEEEDLKEVFGEYGTIKRVYIPTDRETGRVARICICGNGIRSR